MIGRLVAALAAGRATEGPTTEQLSHARTPVGRYPTTPRVSKYCLDCSGSGFKTDTNGVCTTDEDCPACDGTGKPAPVEDGAA